MFIKTKNCLEHYNSKSVRTCTVKIVQGTTAMKCASIDGSQKGNL